VHALSTDVPRVIPQGLASAALMNQDLELAVVLFLQLVLRGLLTNRWPCTRHSQLACGAPTSHGLDLAIQKVVRFGDMDGLASIAGGNSRELNDSTTVIRTK